MMNLTNIDPTKLLLKGDDVRRTFESEWILRLFAKHKDLPQSDVLEFLHKAQLTGANPILNQVYLIERNTKVKEYGQPERWQKRGTVVFSYHFLNAKANESGQFQGYTKKTGPQTRFNPFAQKGEQETMELCCTTTVKRNGYEFSYDAWWSEFSQDNAQWRSKPYLMLEKCSFAGALRMAFPEALSGIYIEDEIKDDDLEADIERKKNNEAIEAAATKTIERVEAIQKKLESKDSAEQVDATINLIAETMAALFKGYDILEKGIAINEHLGVNKFSELKDKPLSHLQLKLDGIKALLAAKILRETKVNEINKNASQPSFILGAKK